MGLITAAKAAMPSADAPERAKPAPAFTALEFAVCRSAPSGLQPCAAETKAAVEGQGLQAVAKLPKLYRPAPHAVQTRPAPTSPLEAKPAMQPHVALFGKLSLFGGHGVQLLAPVAANVRAAQVLAATPPPGQADPAGQGVVLFVACVLHKMPALQGVQNVAPAAEKEPREHKMAATPPPGHDSPAGQGVVLFVACSPQKMPRLHEVQLVAVRPPAE